MKEIGKIVNTHGINGELRVLTNSDFIKERFGLGAEIWVNDQKFIIEDSYQHKNFIIIKLKGYNNINEVMGLKGKIIKAQPLSHDVLDEGEYFNHDLEGCRVFNQQHIECGKVSKVVDGGNYNYLRIKGNKSGLVPFIDSFIIDVNIDNKTIIIEEIEGLLDEN